MKITYDKAKNQTNIEQRGLDFDRVNDVDWSSAIIWEDERKFYGEARYCALGLIDKRLHAVVFTKRSGNMRIISFRKANARERKKYEEKTH